MLSKREKRYVFTLTIVVIFLAAYFIYTTPQRVVGISVATTIMFCFIVFVANVNKIFKKFGLDTRVDGDLKLKVGNENLSNCPCCNLKTISWFHAKKEPQTCGECGERCKAVNFEMREILTLIFCLIATLGGYALVRLFGWPGYLVILSGIFTSTYFLSKGGELKKINP